MQGTSKLALQYNESIQDQLNTICGPLFKYTPIKTFGYSEIFEKGYHFSICTHKTWLKHNILNNYNKSSIFANIVRSTPNGPGLYPFIWPNMPEDPILYSFYYYNMWNGISFFTRTENSIRSFYFACDKSMDIASDFYRKDVEYLFRFINFFMEKAEDIIDTSDRSKLACFREMSTIKPLSVGDLISSEDIQKFLAETPVTKLSLKGRTKIIHLTPRETECIIHLAQGKTAKEIARLMTQNTPRGPRPLSERTVETYITNMKKKSGYRTARELILMVQDNSIKWF